MRWHHIPARPELTVAEQWQVRVEDRGVAVMLRRRRPDGTWEGSVWDAVLLDPAGRTASMVVTNCVTEQAQTEVEHALYQMGWR